jgi:polar amino acid transport system substrate-binding protein
MFSIKRVVVSLVAVLLTAGLVAGSAQATEAPVLERIVQSGKLRVGMSGDQAPFNARTRDGDLMGLEVDLANLLAGALGVEAELVTRPFPRLLDTLAAGEVDVVMSGMAITAERSLKAAFVGPYVLSGKSILTNSKALAAAREAGEINRAELKLAALAGSTSEQFVKKVLPEATLMSVADYNTAVNKVMADEIDALVADMPICVLTLMRHPGKELATLAQPLTVEPVGIAMPMGDPQLKSLLDSYITAFEGTGILPALRKKWLEDGSWVAALP